jgi:hypothetical protein
VHKINGHRPVDILYQLLQANNRPLNHLVHEEIRISRSPAGGLDTLLTSSSKGPLFLCQYPATMFHSSSKPP